MLFLKGKRMRYGWGDVGVGYQNRTDGHHSTSPQHCLAQHLLLFMIEGQGK